jgi:hypothetical protein
MVCNCSVASVSSSIHVRTIILGHWHGSRPSVDERIHPMEILGITHCFV